MDPQPDASEPTAPRRDPGPDAAPDAVATRAQSPLGLDALSGLAERPLSEHVDVYDGLHRDLQAALSEIDSA